MEMNAVLIGRKRHKIVNFWKIYIYNDGAIRSARTALTHFWRKPDPSGQPETNPSLRSTFRNLACS